MERDEMDVRSALAEVVSRYGIRVSARDVPRDIAESYLYGLDTGEWFLKIPKAKDRRLVASIIAAINAKMESRTPEQEEQAILALFSAVFQALGIGDEYPGTELRTGDRITVSQVLGTITWSPLT